MATSAASVAGTPLHVRTNTRKVGCLRRYVRLTGWAWTAKAVLQVAQVIGWIVALPLLYTTPALVMALCPHPIVMIAASQQLPLSTFLLIGLARLLIGTPINYVLGQQNAMFILSTDKHDVRIKKLRKPFGQLRKLIEWLTRANGNWLLAAAFCSRVFPVMPPAISINMLSGVARVGLKRLLVVDGLAIVTCLYLLMTVGSSFDPMGWLHRLI